MANSTVLAPQQFTELGSNDSTWIIVSHAKSHRVMYFTDDEEYSCDTEDHEYFINFHHGQLPERMTPGNCWNWLFNGLCFLQTDITRQKIALEPLLVRNQQALEAILLGKVGVLQKPFCPASPMENWYQEQKLQAARILLSQSDLAGGNSHCSSLIEVAAVNNCTVQEMAELIVHRQTEFEEMLRNTERWRESFAVAIRVALTMKDLDVVHQRLLEESTGKIVPDSIDKSHQINLGNTERSLTPVELKYERDRLHIQLRDRINSFRQLYKTEYLLADVMLQYLDRIAQSLLSVAGDVEKLSQEIDISPLLTQATIRGQPLLETAQTILLESEQRLCFLLKTAQMKDVLSSRIATVQSLADIETTSKLIQSLALPELNASTG